MEKNEEITLSEAKKITGELKASILKLEALNSGVIANIQELENVSTNLVENMACKIIFKILNLFKV